MNDGIYETEVISVDGEEHEVLKRNDHTIGNDIAAASLLVSIMMRNAIQDFTCFANKIKCIGTEKGFSLQMLQPIRQLTATTICGSDK